jgi:hypothetical protein
MTVKKTTASGSVKFKASGGSEEINMVIFKLIIRLIIDVYLTKSVIF